MFLQTTTDLNATCTTKHTGTSASAPLAAGVLALVLQAKCVSIPVERPFTLCDLRLRFVTASNMLQGAQSQSHCVNGP